MTLHAKYDKIVFIKATVSNFNVIKYINLTESVSLLWIEFIVCSV